jgi:hypothetical protein
MMVSHHAISQWFTLLWLIAWWLTIIDLPYCDWLHGDWPSLMTLLWLWLHGDWPSLMTLLWLIVWWLTIIDDPSATDCMVTDYHWWPYCDCDCTVTDHHWWPYCDWLRGDWPSLMTLLWLIAWWLTIIVYEQCLYWRYTFHSHSRVYMNSVCIAVIHFTVTVGYVWTVFALPLYISQSQ